VPALRFVIREDQKTNQLLAELIKSIYIFHGRIKCFVCISLGINHIDVSYKQKS
jgi:hypothetical protein